MTWNEALQAHGFSKETDNPTSWLRLSPARGPVLRAAAVYFDESGNLEFTHESQADLVTVHCRYPTFTGDKFLTLDLAYPDPEPIGIMLEGLAHHIDNITPENFVNG